MIDPIERLRRQAQNETTAPALNKLLHLAEDEIDLLRAERDALRDVLLRNGFVTCDTAACNCGSWHARYGYPERMREIADTLEEAGHALSNENGHIMRNALQQLVAERDKLRAALIAAMEIVQRERVRTVGKAKNGASQNILNWLDAVIAQADAALGEKG